MEFKNIEGLLIKIGIVALTVAIPAALLAGCLILDRYTVHRYIGIAKDTTPVSTNIVPQDNSAPEFYTPRR